MAKAKVATSDDDADIIITEKPKQKKKTNGVKDTSAVFVLVPKGARRRRAGKKTVARKAAIPRPRVKNPAPPRAAEEMSADELFLQAWDYSYKVRHKRQ